MTYWERRQQELNSVLEKDEEKLKKRLSSFYDTEYRKLEKEIAAYYSMYGEDKVIKYRNLMQNLSDDDKERLIKRMQEFVQLYPEYADLLPVRETIYKLNRLEGLQMSVLMQQYEIGAVDNEEIRKHLEKQALRNANAAAETMGYGKNFYTEDSNIIKAVVDTKWCNGKDFSERIWGNVEKLAQYLSSDIAAGFARGDSYEKLVRQLRQRFGKVSRNDAYRLIYTEGTYVMNEARAAAFRQDTEEYIFRVQYDKIRRSGWRDICDDLNEKVFRWDERKPGINFPPMHAWCHCTATPYVSDRQKFIEDYENRHKNGQSQNIVNRMDAENDMRNNILNREYKELSLEEFKKMHHTVSKEERKIIYGRNHFSGYVNSSNARKINGLLRNSDSLSLEYQEIADTLSSVIQKNEIGEDIIVTRYVTTDALESITGVAFPESPGLLSGRSGVEKYWQDIDSLSNQIQKGHTYTEKGFLSTSGVSDKNVMQDKGVLLRIKVPKGTNAYVTTNYKESEIIFNRGSRLEIINSHVENSRTANAKVVLECVMR